MATRIEVLKKVVAAGNDLEEILLDYKITYREMGKPHVAKHLEEGLTLLLKYLLIE